jgi:hypothetical protein
MQAKAAVCARDIVRQANGNTASFLRMKADDEDWDFQHGVHQSPFETIVVSR